MESRLAELRVASERAIEKSRRLRLDSEGIRGWSHRLLVDARQFTRQRPPRRRKRAR
jgi:hypothetical protein